MAKNNVYELLIGQSLLPGIEEVFLSVGIRYNEIRLKLGMPLMNLDLAGSSTLQKKQSRLLKVEAPAEKPIRVKRVFSEDQKRKQSLVMKKRWAASREKTDGPVIVKKAKTRGKSKVASA